VKPENPKILTDDELVDECHRIVLLVFHYPVVVMRCGRDRLTTVLKALEDRKQLELPLDYADSTERGRETDD
jgi:hypothetical protein